MCEEAPGVRLGPVCGNWQPMSYDVAGIIGHTLPSDLLCETVGVSTLAMKQFASTEQQGIAQYLFSVWAGPGRKPGTYTGAKAEAWRLRIHVDAAALSLDVSGTSSVHQARGRLSRSLSRLNRPNS